MNEELLVSMSATENGRLSMELPKADAEIGSEDVVSWRHDHDCACRRLLFSAKSWFQVQMLRRYSKCNVHCP